MKSANDPSPRVEDHSERGPAVRLIDTTKRYGRLLAVDRANLEVRQGELLTLLGPSGSGKTTILRMIAGLVQPTSGEIWLGRERVEERPPYDRSIGLVFQSLALFPHMDVFGNIAFPLRMRRMGRREISRRVDQALDMVRLPNIARRKVAELSGGQQQRVALARALVYEPELLLLDEPLGALDRRLREEMQIEIVRLHRDVDVTIINVTHDQREALMLSDRIGVMRLGRLEQVGSSRELYRKPRTQFVAAFLGEANLLLGAATTDGEHGWITMATGARLQAESLADSLLGQQCAMVVRAESLRIAGFADEEDPPCANRFRGRVAMKAFEGSSLYYELDVPALNTTLKVLTPTTPASREFELGEDIYVSWDSFSADVLGPDDLEQQVSPVSADAAH